MAMSSYLGYRVGDVVRFAYGSNEYTGTILSFSKVGGFCTVDTSTRTRVVKIGSILRIEQHVVTDRERVALTVLARWSVSMPASAWKDHTANGVQGVSPGTLAGLAKRGLVTGERRGVTQSGSMLWQITKEGRRVVR